MLAELGIVGVDIMGQFMRVIMPHPVERLDHPVEVVVAMPMVGMCPTVSVVHPMGWVVLVVVANLVPVRVVDIVGPSVEIGVFYLVMFDAVVGSCLYLVEEIVIFVLDVLHELGAVVELGIVGVCVAVMLTVSVVEIVSMLPVGVVVGRQFMLNEVAVVHNAVGVMSHRMWSEHWGRLVVEVMVASVLPDQVGQIELTMVVSFNHGFVLMMRCRVVDRFMMRRFVLGCLMVRSLVSWFWVVRGLRVRSLMMWHFVVWVLMLVSLVMVLGKLCLVVLDLMWR